MLSAFFVAELFLSVVVAAFIVVRQQARPIREPRLDTAFDRAQFARAVRRGTWQ